MVIGFFYVSFILFVVLEERKREMEEERERERERKREKEREIHCKYIPSHLIRQIN